MADAAVVAGVDESETSRRALLAAVELAARLPAQLAIVHVAERGLPDPPVKRGPAPWWLSDAPASASLVVRHGLAWVELARYAAESNAMMLVIGSHGRSGVNPLNLGSTAAKLTLLAPCPVLVVNERSGEGANGAR